MSARFSRCTMLAAVATTAYLLVRHAAAPLQLWHGLHQPRAWVARVGTDAAVSTLGSSLLWLVALWLAVGLIVTAIGVLPGRVGARAATLADGMLPAVLRNVVIAAVGASILAGPTTAWAQGPTAPAGPGVPTAAAPGWPTDSGRPTASPTDSGRPTATATDPATPPALATMTAQPAPGWPTTPPTATPAPPTAAPTTAPSATAPPRSTPTAPPTAPPTHPVRPPKETPPGQATNSGQVTVTPGDSLWLIAAHRLGPDATDAEIAVEWPHWYSANRALIGADPARLRPGQRLSAPTEPGR